MNFLMGLLPDGDRWLLAAYLMLCLVSLAILWSVTEGISGPYENIESDVAKSVFMRQLLWIVCGWIALLAAARFPLRHLENLALPLFLIAVLLLALVLVIAPAVGGARRWLMLGPLRMQPSEMAKIAYIVLTASVLSRHSSMNRPLLTTIVSLCLTVVPFLLVLREPDLGTSLVFIALWVGMIFWFGISGFFLIGVGTAVLSAVISFYSEAVAQQAWPWCVYLLLVIALLYASRSTFLASGVLLLVNIASGIGIPYFWDQLKPYQQDRIMAFFEPSRDAFGTGYQAIQSKVAIGSGGLFGTHYLQGTQKGLAFLPERHTDFIFSVIGEELGFLGAVCLLGVFLVIILRGSDQAISARRPFPSFLAIGITTYFLFHVVVNVAITTGLLPVTGLPLPLISYGGSNLIVSSFLLGLLVNVSAQRYEE